MVGRAERPSDEQLAEVRGLVIEVGTISAQVGECKVNVTADTVPPRIWSAMVRFAQNRGPLEEAVAGRTQSVHLEHLMAEDWGEPLIPRASAITRACTCDEGNACEHIVALAYAAADRIDSDPSVLLLWRA
ncbi:MAG TPA: SWIM zinc finger family protein, partial [Gaiellaceae bacterium]